MCVYTVGVLCISTQRNSVRTKRKKQNIRPSNHTIHEAGDTKVSRRNTRLLARAMGSMLQKVLPQECIVTDPETTKAIDEKYKRKVFIEDFIKKLTLLLRLLHWPPCMKILGLATSILCTQHK